MIANYQHNPHNNVCTCALGDDICKCTCYFCTADKCEVKEARMSEVLLDTVVPVFGFASGFVTVKVF